jgi:hypothetical protein
MSADHTGVGEGKEMSVRRSLAVYVALASSVAALAASAVEAPSISMKGKWVLNVKESHWNQGGGLTGGVWTVYKDDGKIRQSLLVQNTQNGRLNVFWFDGPYGDNLVWCNDWYREGYKSTGPDSFTVSWEAERGGQTFKGGPDGCKYSNNGTKLTCENSNFTEVYEKVK